MSLAPLSKDSTRRDSRQSVAHAPRGAPTTETPSMKNDQRHPHRRHSAGQASTFFPALVLMPHTGPAQAQTWMSAASLHSLAIEKFRHGRFPEAYGRFVQLANAGHAPSVRSARWMGQEGPTLFGSNWDSTPDEVVEWTALSRRITGAVPTWRAHREPAAR